MLNFAVLFALLFVTWIIFSGFFSKLFIILGIVSCFAAAFVGVLMNFDKGRIFGLLGILSRLPGYLSWLIKEIIISGIDVTIKVWQIEPEISPEMEWISTSIQDDLGLTILGNSITLTPGTVTVLVREGMLQVHGLTKESVESLRDGKMAAKSSYVVSGVK